MIEKKSKHMSLVVMLLIIGIFSLASLLLVNIGHDVYNKLVYKNSSNYSIRTSLSYIATKIRQMDEEGSIVLEKRQGTDVLVMYQKVHREEYENCVYFKDGKLYEAFGKKGESLPIPKGPGKGWVTEVGDFGMEEVNSNLLRFTAGDRNGKKESITINIRSRR